MPLPQVRAAFHYIPTGTTIAPVDLLDADGIGDLLAALRPGRTRSTGRERLSAGRLTPPRRRTLRVSAAVRGGRRL